MRHLLLLRHAEASSGLGVEDHERPLTPQGRQDAQRLGQQIAAAGLAPQLALCSSARRAQETLAAICASLSPPPRVTRERGLYLADPSALLARLAEVEEEVETLLLVGHNPTVAAVVHELARDADGEAAGRLRRGFPAGTLATFGVHEGWARLRPGRAELLELFSPGDLTAEPQGAGLS